MTTSRQDRMIGKFFADSIRDILRSYVPHEGTVAQILEDLIYMDYSGIEDVIADAFDPEDIFPEVS